MHKVTLVCSAHQECGRCNAEELLKILRAIEPETIFEELRPGELPLYYNQGFVEARAVTDYRDYKSFQHVPVDQYDMPKDLLGEKRELDQVFLWVKQTSQEYRELMERESDSLCRFRPRSRRSLAPHDLPDSGRPAHRRHDCQAQCAAAGLRLATTFALDGAGA